MVIVANTKLQSCYSCKFVMSVVTSHSPDTSPSM